MKKFENPTLEIEKFEIMDVITTSNEENGCNGVTPEGCDDDLGLG